MSHTPGPWRFETGNDFGIVPTHWKGKENLHDCAFIASVSPWDGNPKDPDTIAEARANAHLIASAPEMLQALGALLDREERITEHGECALCYATPNFVAEGDIIHADDCPLELIRAAIARARGLS